MLKHKKFFTTILVAVTLLLVACGGTPATSGEDVSTSTEIQEESNRVDDTIDSQNKDKDNNVELETFSTTATIEKTVLLDENDIKITASGLSYTDYSVELSLMIENNSDKDLRFISNSMAYNCNAINGYMVDDGYLNTDVAAGKKANEAIRFSIDGLIIYGITEIADIQIGFDISDENYNHIYSGPRQVKTSAVDSYDYTADTYSQSINSGVLKTIYDYTIDYYAEDELYNQNGIRIVSEALMTNKDGEKTVLLEIENNSSEYVYGVTTDISVNGLVVYSSTWSSDSINPGTRRIMDLSLSSMLDEACWDILGISDIGEFTCSFTIQDADHTEIIAPQEISISIPAVAVSVDSSGMELYNENDICFILKGIVEDSSAYSNDIHMLLLVENNFSEVISIDDVYDSLSVNSFMTDYIAPRREIPVGRCAVIDVDIRASSLETNGITGIEDITEAEISFEIKGDNHKVIAEPKLSIIY